MNIPADGTGDAVMDVLGTLARKYIWWQSPEESLGWPERIIAQVMNIGTIEDTSTLETLLPSGTLQDVLRHAQPGWFRPKSWTFWHYRLGLIQPGDEVPELPARKFS